MQHRRKATVMFRAWATCIHLGKEQQCKIENITLARKRNVLPFLAFLEI